VGTYALRVGPLGGTRYDTYIINWTYGTRMLVLNVRTWSRDDVPGSRFNRIHKILISSRYTFFFRSSTIKNSRVKHP
jgi:hypothetical protein